MDLKRTQTLITKNTDNHGDYILYWMQQAQRVSCNQALSEAVNLANTLNLPLLVVFNLTSYPEANLRHYQFALEGLQEVASMLTSLNINFVVKLGDPSTNLFPLICKAHSVFFDVGYLKIQKKWRRELYNKIINTNLAINLYSVETDVIVPLSKVYDKAAYGAYVLRPKIMKLLYYYDYINPLNEILNKAILNINSDVNLSCIDSITNKLDIDRSVKPYHLFKGGYTNAIKMLEQFINNKMNDYLLRSDPSLNIQSYLSPYLHFGQISSLEILNIVKQALSDNKINGLVFDSFCEQLIVRRELAFNFVAFTRDYDTFEGMSEKWAYQTMAIHDHDYKEVIYSLEEMEQSKTDDIYFNAAMKEMRITGFMANYLRMYWAKQIVAWSPSFRVAYETIVYLNNKYFYDGRDANSYANIAWIFGKNDRAWPERPIFGKLRVMNSAGLKRKFKIADYLSQIDDLKEE